MASIWSSAITTRWLKTSKRQQAEEKGLRILDRIPLHPDLPGVKEAVEHSAEYKKLETLKVQVMPGSVEKVPTQIWNDLSPPFALKPQQVAGTIAVNLVRAGERKIRSSPGSSPWKDFPPRLLRPEGGYSQPVLSPAQGGGDVWQVKAEAYYFADIAYPKIKVREPLDIFAGPHARAF